MPLTKGYIHALKAHNAKWKNGHIPVEILPLPGKAVIYDQPIRIFRHSLVRYSGQAKKDLMRQFKIALGKRACLEEQTYPLPVELLFGLKPGTFRHLYAK